MSENLQPFEITLKVPGEDVYNLIYMVSAQDPALTNLERKDSIIDRMMDEIRSRRRTEIDAKAQHPRSQRQA
jgi:hypothetical protein